MQLIIPMSGLGERFLKVGYKVPKPLINVEGKSIISHIIDMFPGVDSVFFICNKNHIENKELKMRETLLKIKPESQIITIDQHKKGPIHAVLSSIKEFDLKKPTIVNYCDFNCLWDFKEFLNYVEKTKCDGCVVTYTGFHPHMLGNTNYAYLEVKNSRIKNIQEKKPFTSSPMNEYASSGTYYFRTAQLMKKYFKRAIKEDLNVKGEFYVSMSYKPMIKDNLDLRIFNLKYFMQWGTPEDLKEYLWFSNLFKSKTSQIEKEKIIDNSTLMIPCAGLGSRFQKEGYKYPKPLIKVGGKSMLIQAINDLLLFKYKKVILRKNIQHIELLKNELKENFPDINIQILPEETDGQASTCLMGLENIEKDYPLVISACDNGIIYNEKSFYNLIKDKSIDILFWGCRNYPG